MYRQQQQSNWMPMRPRDNNGYDGLQPDMNSGNRIEYDLPFRRTPEDHYLEPWTAQPYHTEQLSPFSNHLGEIVYPQTSTISEPQPQIYDSGLTSAWSSTLPPSSTTTGSIAASNNSPALSSYSTFSGEQSPQMIEIEGPPADWMQPHQGYIVPAMINYSEIPTFSLQTDQYTTNPVYPINHDPQPTIENEPSPDPQTPTKTDVATEQESKVHQALKKQLHRRKRVMTTTETAKVHCEDCGMGFKRNCNLVLHMTTHSEQRTKVKCEYAGCGLMYDRKTDLSRHEKSVHLRVKDHQCPLCDASFPRKDTLRKHIEASCARKHGITKKRLKDLL